MDKSTLLTLLVFTFLGMVGAYYVAWRWLSGRFGYSMDGKYHIILFIFFAPFVVGLIGVIYLITLLTDKSNGNTGGGDEIDI